MTTSAALQALLNCKSNINYYTTQQIFWTNLYNSNEEKLTQLTKYQTTWQDAYDKAYAAESDLKIGGEVYIVKDTDYANETKAKAYANAKCPQYVGKDEILDDLEIKDSDYDTMKTMYETMLEEENAEYEKLKELTSNRAQDPGTLD